MWAEVCLFPREDRLVAHCFRTGTDQEGPLRVGSRNSNRPTANGRTPSTLARHEVCGRGRHAAAATAARLKMRPAARTFIRPT